MNDEDRKQDDEGHDEVSKKATKGSTLFYALCLIKAWSIWKWLVIISLSVSSIFIFWLQDSENRRWLCIASDHVICISEGYSTSMPDR